eukprot:759307-Hanusia_phi.AAC.6
MVTGRSRTHSVAAVHYGSPAASCRLCIRRCRRSEPLRSDPGPWHPTQPEAQRDCQHSLIGSDASTVCRIGSVQYRTRELQNPGCGCTGSDGVTPGLGRRGRDNHPPQA